jgi:hypothetical protein
MVEKQVVVGYIGLDPFRNNFVVCKPANVKDIIMCPIILPEPAIKMDRHLSLLFFLPLSFWAALCSNTFVSLRVPDRAALWSNNHLELVFSEHGSRISAIGLNSPREKWREN